MNNHTPDGVPGPPRNPERELSDELLAMAQALSFLSIAICEAGQAKAVLAALEDMRGAIVSRSLTMAEDELRSTCSYFRGQKGGK